MGDADQAGEASRFDFIAVGSELVSSRAFVIALYSGEDCEGDVIELVMPANPTKGFEVVVQGQAQRQYDGDGERVDPAVGELAGAAEVVDGLVFVGNKVNRVLRRGLV